MVKDHTYKESGRKEMFYLIMYSTHSQDVGHMVMDRTDKESGRNKMFYLIMYSKGWTYG